MTADTRQFTYNAATRTFCADISDFKFSKFHQVYPDSADEGLTLVSHVTGREVDYVVQHVERDREGDIQYWELVPTKQSLRRCPEARGTKIQLFND